MYTLEIKEKKDNLLETIITKGNVTFDFSIDDVVTHKQYVEKVIKENTAQLSVWDKQDELAVEILPILKELPDDKLTLIGAYVGRQLERKAINDLLETSNKTLESYKDTLDRIKNELGIDWEQKPEEKPEEVTEQLTEEVKEDGQ